MIRFFKYLFGFLYSISAKLCKETSLILGIQNKCVHAISLMSLLWRSFCHSCTNWHYSFWSPLFCLLQCLLFFRTVITIVKLNGLYYYLLLKNYFLHSLEAKTKLGNTDMLCQRCHLEDLCLSILCWSYSHRQTSDPASLLTYFTDTLHLLCKESFLSFILFLISIFKRLSFHNPCLALLFYKHYFQWIPLFGIMVKKTNYCFDIIFFIFTIILTAMQRVISANVGYIYLNGLDADATLMMFIWFVRPPSIRP